MNDTEINDIRISNDFKSSTFSKYKKTLVIKEFLNSLMNSKIENSCNWAAELICAGHFIDLWEIILTFMSKNIHLANPKLPIYIEMRFNKFKDILINGYIGNELAMRNDNKIRILFTEIICILCLSKKTHCFEQIKIKKIEEFDITQMTSRLKAPNINYATEYFLKDDPKELFVAINEFAYNLSNNSKNNIIACYWIEWIIEFDNICKKKNEKCSCERRTFAPVQQQFQTDIIWIIWDILLNKSKKLEICNKIMISLLNIFSIKYNNTTKRKRRYILYFAVSLITDLIDYKIDIILNKKEIKLILSKIDHIYKQIKKNEIAPKTEYLFDNIKNTEKTNLTKTIEKLNIMKNLIL